MITAAGLLVALIALLVLIAVEEPAGGEPPSARSRRTVTDASTVAHISEEHSISDTGGANRGGS